MKSKIGMIIVCVFSFALLALSIYMDKRQRLVSEFDNIDYSDGYDDGYDEGYNDAEIYYSDERDFYNACHTFIISSSANNASTVKFGDWFEFEGYTLNITCFKKNIEDEEKTRLRLSVKMKNGQTSFTEDEIGDKKLNLQSAYDGIFRYDEKENKYYCLTSLTGYFCPDWTDDEYEKNDNVEYVERTVDIPISTTTLYVLFVSDSGQVTAIILQR